jgi:hypothetical protein
LKNEIAKDSFLEDLTLFHGQTEDLNTKPGIIINAPEVKEIAPGCGIFEATLEVSLSTQSNDDGGKKHADRVGKILALCLNSEDVVFSINAKQNYIHLSGIYLDTQINSIIGTCWMEILRFKATYLVREF